MTKQLNEKEIETKFNKVLDSLTDDEFWLYVKNWYDEQSIFETMNEWEIETKKDAIDEMLKVKKDIRATPAHKFQELISNANREQLKEFKDTLDNEIRLSEIAIKQGVELSK